MRTTLIALSLLALACNTVANVPEPWSLQVTSDGGFTGRGVGTITTDSDHASEALRRAVAASKPERWEREYTHPDAPNGYADEVRYTLTLTSGDHKYVVSWRETAPRPKDLRAIHDAARAAK